jgi:large subunit ribosomal protein L24
MAARIRKGDTVVVISGVNKGRRGEVLRVMPQADRAVVQGVAMVTRHVKPRGMQEPGGMREQESAVHLSNLMLIDPRSEKPTKVGYRFVGEGDQRRKVRVAKTTGEVIES